MCGLTVRPLAAAFFASRPAASNTPGFEVFVHEVIAAISTSPLPMSTGLGPVTATRSCVGRLSTISTTSSGFFAPCNCWALSLVCAGAEL